jgi:MarR family transcriptional regulator, organic hydroperoxide resistance regulator
LTLANIEVYRYHGSQVTTAASKSAQSSQASDPEAAREAWGQIQRLSGEMKKRYLTLAGEFELSPPQFWSIRHLVEPRTMSDLADTLLCDNSNVTGIIDRLEERGLVERRPAPGDRRAKLLFLTRDGERVRRRIEKVMEEPPAWLAELPGRDQRQLRDVLRRAAARDAEAAA